jgi:hypothetical protein
VATSVATSRSSITSISSTRLDDLDDMDALDGFDTRVTRLRAWSRLTGWRFESSSAHRKALQSGAFRVSVPHRRTAWAEPGNFFGNIRRRRLVRGCATSSAPRWSTDRLHPHGATSWPAASLRGSLLTTPGFGSATAFLACYSAGPGPLFRISSPHPWSSSRSRLRWSASAASVGLRSFCGLLVPSTVLRCQAGGAGTRAPLLRWPPPTSGRSRAHRRDRSTSAEPSVRGRR